MRVTYDPPPIPVRTHDWSAVLDDYDAGDPIGWGPTREAAIADLLSQVIVCRCGSVWKDQELELYEEICEPTDGVYVVEEALRCPDCGRFVKFQGE